MARRSARQWEDNTQKSIKTASTESTIQDYQHTHELSHCQILYAILFSFLSPIVGYSYTGRFTALGVFLIGGLIMLTAVTQTEQGLDIKNTRVKMGLGIGIAAAAAADNSRAILAARKQNSRA